MRHAPRAWLFTAVCLVVAGVILIAAVSARHWQFTDLSTEDFITNTYDIREAFQSISIESDTADILFSASDDDACHVICYEEAKLQHSVEVRSGTLTIKAVDERSWVERIGFRLHSPEVTVFLPRGEYASLTIHESTGSITLPAEVAFETAALSLSTGDVALSSPVSQSLKVETTTGDILVHDTSAGSLALSASTGKITVSDVACAGDVRVDITTGTVALANVTCRSLSSTGSTSDITLQNVIAAEAFSLVRSTGDVRFLGSDASDIFVQTDTGDVTGSLLTEKVFLPVTSTGDIRVPKTVTGGRCEVTTSTGSISLEIAG